MHRTIVVNLYGVDLVCKVWYFPGISSPPEKNEDPVEPSVEILSVHLKDHNVDIKPIIGDLASFYLEKLIFNKIIEEKGSHCK